MTACSTNKNTWGTRTVQSINTRFNVYFNARVSYEEALKAILATHQDDFGQVIPMYPISNHENAKAATGQLDRTIEKCRKAIKTRSIKVKPKYNVRKASRPGYREFMQQEEYNPFMSEVWLLLAKAEFHKADFLGSVGTFNYIARHFKEDADLVMTCRLWVIRSYGELGWLYEADDLVTKLNQQDLQGDNVPLFAAVQADLLLKKQQYKEAIPYLQLALKSEEDKELVYRFHYLLAQLHEHTGEFRKANDLYAKLIRMSPPFEMAFNARINRAGLFVDDLSDVRRDLQKMAKNNNHRDYLDQIYYTMAKSYLHEQDTVAALGYLQDAVDYSIRNGIDKAVALTLMGDIYYTTKEYVKAQPAYEEASRILVIDHPDYDRVFNRTEVLAELVVQHEMVMLQDSLQRLSAMSEEERLSSILAYIQWMEEQEKMVAEKEARMEELRAESEAAGMNTMGMPVMGMNPDAQWYFYNTNLIRSGQGEFQQRWGRRKLEDNWRRENKTAVLFAEEDGTSELLPEPEMNDSIAPIDGEVPMDEMTDVTSDPKDPAYYLRQIPVTEEQIALSDQLWADALFQMGSIFQDKLADYQLAIKTFQNYIRRFPTHEQVPEAYYKLYLVYNRVEEYVLAEEIRRELIMQHPNNQYADLLQNPDYMEVRQEMLLVQDSLYRLAYTAFNKSEFQRVMETVDFVADRYPLSSLMPKFLFLKALSIGKTQEQIQFETALNALLEAYPVSDVSAISKDILALIKQGRESKQGTTHGTMLARREAELSAGPGIDSIQISFQEDEAAVHRVMFLSTATEEELYELQFQIALFNFSRFLFKDFDLNIMSIDASRNAISVIDFDNLEEAEWYVQTIEENTEIMQLIEQFKVSPLIISEHNFSLIQSDFSLEDYLLYNSTLEETGNPVRKSN